MPYSGGFNQKVKKSTKERKQKKKKNHVINVSLYLRKLIWPSSEHKINKVEVTTHLSPEMKKEME